VSHQSAFNTFSADAEVLLRLWWLQSVDSNMKQPGLLVLLLIPFLAFVSAHKENENDSKAEGPVVKAKVESCGG